MIRFPFTGHLLPRAAARLQMYTFVEVFVVFGRPNTTVFGLPATVGAVVHLLPNHENTAGLSPVCSAGVSRSSEKARITFDLWPLLCTLHQIGVVLDHLEEADPLVAAAINMLGHN